MLLVESSARLYGCLGLTCTFARLSVRIAREPRLISQSRSPPLLHCLPHATSHPHCHSHARHCLLHPLFTRSPHQPTAMCHVSRTSPSPPTFAPLPSSRAPTATTWATTSSSAASSEFSSFARVSLPSPSVELTHLAFKVHPRFRPERQHRPMVPYFWRSRRVPRAGLVQARCCEWNRTRSRRRTARR